MTASVSLGDVNGDGALDVVIANGRHWPGQNRVYLNDGGAAFTLARRLGEEEAGTYAVPLADFDGDGDLDIAVGNDRTRNLVASSTTHFTPDQRVMAQPDRTLVRGDHQQADSARELPKHPATRRETI